MNNIIIKSKPIATENKTKKSKEKKDGNRNQNDEITILQAKKIYIESKTPLVVKADGDAFTKTPIDIVIIPLQQPLGILNYPNLKGAS